MAVTARTAGRVKKTVWADMVDRVKVREKVPLRSAASPVSSVSATEVGGNGTR